MKKASAFETTNRLNGDPLLLPFFKNYMLYSRVFTGRIARSFIRPILTMLKSKSNVVKKNRSKLNVVKIGLS